jgi:hypothetical protein
MSGGEDIGYRPLQEQMPHQPYRKPLGDGALEYRFPLLLLVSFFFWLRNCEYDFFNFLNFSGLTVFLQVITKKTLR